MHTDRSLALVVGVGVSLLANLATTVYLHRALAHRALALRPPAAQVFRFVDLGHHRASGPASGSPCTASTTPSPTSRAIRTPPCSTAG